MNYAIRFLLIALVLFTGSAFAARWTIIGDDIEQGVKTFIDVDSLNKEGPSPTMWTVVDYESPRIHDGKEQLSTKSLDEYDCKNQQYRTLAFYWYSKHRGQGELVYSETSPGMMMPIVPGSVSEKAWKYACGKK